MGLEHGPYIGGINISIHYILHPLQMNIAEAGDFHVVMEYYEHLTSTIIWSKIIKIIRILTAVVQI